MPRSFLYVPARRPELFDKAVSGPADAVILDLEDSVPWSSKADARDALSRWLGDRPGHRADTEIWVRANAELLADDVAAVAHPAVAGLVLAKADPDVVAAASRLLDEHESAASLTPGSIRLIGLVETARGLLSLPDMAASSRLRGFGLGEVDLLADLRIERRLSTASIVDRLRTELVIHSAATGLEPPMAPTSTAFRDLDAFRESSEHLFALGFRSRTAVHPAQVPVIHDALRPSDADVVEAREVLAAFATAEGGITQDAAGHMVDAATVRRAREIVARAPEG